MAWRCSICFVFVAVTQRVLMRHIYSEHSQAPNFQIGCNVNNCQETFRKYNSFYRHVMKTHSQLLDRPNKMHVQQLARNMSNNSDQEQADIMHMDTEEVTEKGTEDNPREDNMDVAPVHVECYDTCKAVSFIMNLKEMHRIRETTAEAVANGINGIVQKYIEILKIKVHHHFQSAGIPEHINALDELFDVDLPFHGVVTSHERKKFIKENFLYVEPELVRVGQRLRVVRQRGNANLDVVGDSFFYVPITQSIEQFLQNEDILELIMQDPIPFDGFFFF